MELWARPRKKVNGKNCIVARLIVEESTGRKLTSDEWVHHKDGNPFNNDLENLEVMKKLDHLKYHGLYRKESDNPNEAWCSICGRFLDKKLFYRDRARWNETDRYCKECRIRKYRGYFTYEKKLA